MHTYIVYRIMLIIFLSLYLAVNSEAQNTTECTSDEIVLFSCSIKNKVALLCGSPDLSKDTGYLVYRFGYPGKTPELVYPSKGERPAKAFSLYRSTYAKSRLTQISFTNGQYTYTLYHESSVFDSSGSGIVIEASGKRIAHLRCAEESIISDYVFEYLDLSKLEPRSFP